MQVAFIAAGALAGYVWNRRQAAARAQARFYELASGRAPGARVAVVGAGFAGLAAAAELGRAGIEGQPVIPILIDRNNFHLFTPLLYQVATGGVEPGHITYPTRFIARDQGLLFRESELRGVDLQRKRLVLDDGTLDYDYLILALGSIPNFFGMADVARHTISLKWTGDAVEIHNRIVDAFERADLERDPARRRELLTFVVVGGGSTGIEFVSSLYDVIHRVLLQDYPTIRAEDVRLMLVEGKDQLLPGGDPRMSARVLRRLREQRIEVLLNTVVAGAAEGSIRTRDGRAISAGTIIWTAGVKAPDLTEQLPTPRARDGRLQVNRYLELPEHPDVYAVGDLAYFVDPGTGRPLPPNAQVAIQEGKAAAANVVRQLRGESPRPFVYRPVDDVVSLGQTRAIADLFGIVFDGFPAWLIRRTIYVANLVGYKNRLDVLLDWIADFFHRANAARIEYSRRLELLPAVAEPPRRQQSRGQPPAEQPPEEERPAA